MNRELSNTINLCLNAVNCITLLTIFFLTLKKIEKSKNKRNFTILILTVFIFNLADCANWTCEGLTHPWNVPVLRVFTFIYYIISPIIYLQFMKFVRCLFEDKYLNNKFYILCIITCSISITFALLSCFPGFLYNFSSENIYSRSKYQLIGVANTFLFYVWCICYIFSCKKLMNKKTFFTVLTFPTLPMLFYIPQLFLYGIATVNIGLVLSIMFLYFNVYKKMKIEESVTAFNSEFFKKKKEISLAEKIKRLFCTYGFSENAIESIEGELHDDTISTLKINATGTFTISFACYILSFFIDNLKEINSLTFYISTINGIFIILLYAIKHKKSFIVFSAYVTYLLIAAACAYFYLVLAQDKTPVILIIILFILPTVFCYKPYIMMLVNFSAVFIFMDLADIYRPAIDKYSDYVTLFFTTTTGLIIGYAMSKTKITSIYLKKNLDKEVAAKTKQINTMSKEIVLTLMSSIESKDEYTNGHSARVADYSVLIAKKSGWTEEQCDELWMEAILHDIGKIGVPDNILKKADWLTDTEFKVVQNHTTQGAKILENLSSFPKATEAAKFHHEKVNGQGYPNGLKGKEIPASARIVAIADAYDAMTSCRCYRPALEDSIVLSELIKGRGSQFDAEFLDVFLELLEENGGTLVKRD